jgi:hypothetical protein
MSLTNEEKCEVIASTILRRRGRMDLVAAMLVPMGGSGQSKCSGCALRMMDCEVIRPTDDDEEDCWVPDGVILVWDEREEG